MEYRKMTNSEVVKALRSCASGTCNRCPREFVFENGPECRAHLEQAAANRLESCISALTLPDGTVMGPEEVAALVKRCEAAEAELASFVQIDGDPGWHPTYSDPDSGGQNAGRYYYKAERGPQEGATAHERV